MMAPDAPPLVLASGSAARHALMEAAGLDFETVVPDVDEAALKRDAIAFGHAAETTALALAMTKAATVQALRPDAVIVAADQILVCEGRWFDKPADLAQARAHLRSLAGRTHRLATAVVCIGAGEPPWHHRAAPTLAMRDLSESFIEAYVSAEGTALLGSVGAYRLEAAGIHLFTAVEGEHSAILGLPMLPLLAHLRARELVLA